MWSFFKKVTEFEKRQSLILKKNPLCYDKIIIVKWKILPKHILKFYFWSNMILKQRIFALWYTHNYDKWNLCITYTSIGRPYKLTIAYTQKARHRYHRHNTNNELIVLWTPDHKKSKRLLTVNVGQREGINESKCVNIPLGIGEVRIVLQLHQVVILTVFTTEC